MDKQISVYLDDIDTDDHEYTIDLTDHFSAVPDVAKPLLNGAKKTFEMIKNRYFSFKIKWVIFSLTSWK